MSTALLWWLIKAALIGYVDFLILRWAFRWVWRAPLLVYWRLRRKGIPAEVASTWVALNVPMFWGKPLVRTEPPR